MNQDNTVSDKTYTFKRRKQPLLFSIRVGLSFVYSAIVILGIVLVSVTILAHTRRIMREGMRDRIRDIVSIAALQISASNHAMIKTREDESKPEYKVLRGRLIKVREHIPEIRFIYTIRKVKPDRFEFVLDAETNAADRSHPGDLVKDVSPILRRVFEDPKGERVELNFFKDRWGNWLSGYAPIFATDGTIASILGVDISAKTIVTNERQVTLHLALLTLAIALIAVVVGLYFSSRISKPLSVLATDMRKVRNLHLDEPANVESNLREVVDMREALITMKSGLRSFSKYVPTDLVRALIREGNEARLGGRHETLTVFFSDIANFASLAEARSPGELAQDLAQYFSIVTRTILENRGTVDKYIGDAVMAFWGAPEPLPNHAQHAVLAALKVKSYLNELNLQLAKKGKPPMETRIGLATGEVLVGNIGYEDRFDYTVLGDTVNIASRLEGLNKRYGTKILASAAVVESLGDSVLVRLVDKVVVKGRRNVVTVYEPICLASDASSDTIRRIDQWNEMVLRYWGREFEMTTPFFEAWFKNAPEDLFSAEFAKRSAEFEKKPPPEGWMGTVYTREK
jgi:adenylate cyclase